MPKKRMVWPSKIGTMPGPVVAVKGYPSSPPPVGTRILYKEVRFSKNGTPLLLPGYPWLEGIVTRYSSLIHIDRI